MPPGPPDEEHEAATRAALQQTLEQLMLVLDGLKDLKTAVDLEQHDPRPDAKIIPFPRSPRQG
ncbi:MAG TPA: hypothetical protein VND93_24020 [Myxococcales bacterium]|nr:hypothetical protein [Myxococcales bacterium]